MTHAWLFTGPPGSGRSVAARALAAALQCDRADGEPGLRRSAPSCRAVRPAAIPTCRSVVPEGLSIGVAEMRAVVGQSARRPSLGRWQVVVIEDADRLTEGASNALLKAIEEPPERTVFLLCAPSTHPDDVIVTIRSRCRVVGAADPAGGRDRRRCCEPTASTPRPRPGRRRPRRATSGAPGGWPVTARPATGGRPCWRFPASLTSLDACFEAADQLVSAAEAEATDVDR